MGAVPKGEDERVAEAQKMLDAAVARQRAKKEAEKAFWDEYHAQLEKSTPHQGGAKHRRIRVRRVW